MRKTLLVAVQSALGELGQSRPQVVVSSTENQTQQMLALLIAVCDELAQLQNWQELLTSHTFTTASNQNRYVLPSDCLRIVDSTIWNETARTPVFSVPTDATWAALDNASNASPTALHYRLQGSGLYLLPTPTTAHVYSFDYISAKYVMNAGDGVLKTDFVNDSDGFVFDDRLVINGLKLKYLEAKGFDTTAALSDFNRSLESVRSTNRPASPLTLNASRSFPLIGVNNIPNGNW